MLKFPTVLYRRDTYIERIKPFIHTPIVKVMIGHRRVGKSYILYQLIDEIRNNEHDANIIYINKEDIAYVDIVSSKDLHDYIASRLMSKRKNYIFIDEIQEIEGFKVAIRSLALDDSNDIYITGSNSEMFSSDLANELGGRYVEFKIYSLSYMEFLDFHKLNNDDESLEKYIRFGGLPYLIHLPMREEVVMEYIRSVYSTIVLRDVVARNNIRNTAFLEQLIRFLADNIGSLFSSKSISDFLKSQNIRMSPTLVSEYADSLASAFVVHRLGRYDIVGKRLFER
ncbi:MAG TPA: ATP-binding protein, partial [Bacteroidales bacterium]|nr:ATP-binding protein [Bacteroidales bacterium]